MFLNLLGLLSNVVFFSFGVVLMNKRLVSGVVAKLRYKKLEPYLSNIELTIDSKKITMSKQGERSESTWETFSSKYCDDDVITLMKSPLLMTILPKRIFKEKEWNWVTNFLRDLGVE